MIPSNAPASSNRVIAGSSVMLILRCLMHLLLFLCHPMPRIEAADGQSDNQQGERPGMYSWMMPVQPKAKHCAEQCWRRHRPADESRHAETKPDAAVSLAACPELASGLCLHLLQ